MRYLSFRIHNYRAIREPLTIDLEKTTLVPLVGINECGKTTILQAIFCFDSVNDARYGGAHLKNFLNLYHTKEDDPEVAATIEIAFAELMEACREAVGIIEQVSDENSSEDKTLVSENEAPQQHPFLRLRKSDFHGRLTIARNLKTSKYTIPLFKDVSPDDVDELAQIIISHMPYILYNDDFSDRPPNKIDIPYDKPSGSMPEWLAIYEELFKRTNSAYSVFSITTEKDPRRQESILSDVQALLNQTLSQAWKSFSPTADSPLTIKLTLKKIPAMTAVSSHFNCRFGLLRKCPRGNGFSA